MRIQYGPNFNIVDANSKREVCADEIRHRVNDITKLLKNAEIRSSDVVYLDIERSIDTVLAIISCLQLQLAFTFCKSNSNICEAQLSHCKFKTTLIFNGEEVTRVAVPDNEDDLDICYVINTSGTSGNGKKQVAVPVDCIKKNIEYFCLLFDITSSDSILFSTSLLFDPSIVELFMSFHVGCKLILTPDYFRSEPHRMQKTIEEFRPTVAQFTPTVFEILPSPDSLLSSTSSLRILLLGGSHFPLDFINTIKSSNNPTRIFNVYGVTEVSCWATAYELETGCEGVEIGTEIVGTNLEVDSSGELILGGPRQCYVNGIKGVEHRTGDRVQKTKTGGIRIVGRMDRVVKHQGIRVCLDHVNELALRDTSSVKTSHLIHYNSRNLIQLITSTSRDKEPSVQSKLVELDGNISVMVTTIRIDALPINSSGKVDENELRKICDKRFNETQKIPNEIRKILKKRLGIHLDDVMNQSFVEIGVHSLMAAEISLYFGSNQENALREILNDRRTIQSVLQAFEVGVLCILGSKKTAIIKVNVSKKLQPRMRWAVDLGKCIDGNVLVIRKDLVACASHSGVVVTVNPVNGICLWRTECKVRFECAPILVNKEIVIGSKSSGLWFLSLETGEVLETKVFDQSFGVRAKCTFDGKFIYCTTENGYIHAINPENRCSVFHYCIETNGGGTSVGPVISPDNYIFATTTSGSVTKISVMPNFRPLYSKRFGPIFSEPLFLDENLVLIISVHGVLKVLHSETGAEMDSISLDNENCFCSPLRLRNKLLIATQTGRIISLNLKPKLEISKIFNFHLPGISFVKTPIVLNDNPTSADLMMISKNGWLLYGRFLYSEQFEEMKAVPISNKEVFTRPEIIYTGSRKLVLIAGRDDYLRCFCFDNICSLE